MERYFISYQQSTFSYLKGGRGKKVLLCLHGFGEEADTFSFLEPYLADEFTVYAPDLPWHGQTKWNGKLTFPIKELVALLERIIPDFNNQLIELLCFSMGGRVGLSLLERIPQKIERAVLLAPDGLNINGWYWLATQTWAGNGLFRYTMKHPQWFGFFVDQMNRRKWINSSVAKYVHHYIDVQKVRDDLYNIWTTMRKFRPDLHLVKKKLAEQHICLHLIFGSFDRIIPAKNGYRFQQGSEDWIRVYELQAGHQLLREKNAAFILSLLASPSIRSPQKEGE